ncbi:MAG: hypothetical protein KIT29_03870 [Anaerolineales bacterium]|nr:hypothetical protein [Anaerolineales bacterium]MCW5839031.1 hypothetical protein [Anaerolineales bacterium]
MTILLTKVRAPQRRKDVLRRVRLVDTLHQNLHRKLTFVSAPAGYGKTTLLVDFAADVDAHVCWYRVGPEDGDLVQFALHIVAAFQQQFPGFGEALEEHLNTPGATPDAPSIATELINAIQEQVKDFCVLVLDDYHLAGENQQIVDFLESLLEHLPDHLRILIGSRSVYGIPAASLYIRDELVTISADELRFRADELQKLVLQNYRMRLTQEEAEELAKRADGWIVALLLAVRAISHGALPRFLGDTEQVYTYLAEEVVNQQSEELRAFMLGASVFSDFSEAQCNFLLQRQDSGQMLRALEERNLFVSRTETREGTSYRFHQLFAEFLQDYFARHDAARLHHLQSRAAEWHFARQEWESAVAFKLAAGETEQAAEWMDAAAEHFYTTGRQALLARWLEELGTAPALRQLAPRLLLYQAKSLGNQNQFEECLKLLAEAEPVLRDRGDVQLLANALITRGMVYRFTGNTKGAIGLADAAQELLSETRSYQWYQAERLRGVSLHLQGQTRTGIHHLEDAVRGLRQLAAEGQDKLKGVYVFNLAECLSDLGWIHIVNGQILLAQQAFQEALDIHVSIRSNLGALAAARNNIAYLHHQVGHYPAAWKEYSLALGHAHASGQVRAEIAILSGQGELLLDLGELAEAEAVFEHALQLGQRDAQLDLALIYAGQARVQRLQGNGNEAMALLRQAASKPSNTFGSDDYALELGCIYLAMGQTVLAREEFAKCLVNAQDGQPRPSTPLAAFHQALLLHAAGELPPAKDLFALALQIAARLGYDQFLVVAAQRHLEALARALADVQLPALEKLHARAAAFQPGRANLGPPSPVEQVPDTNLEVHAFGSSTVSKDGAAIHSAVWRSSRAKALFFYILDQGRVRKEAIGLDFWPDFSISKISSNFHATLWRVRQALGFKEAIVFEDESYSLHPSLHVWYDVAEFQNYLAMAEASGLADAERAELLRQAIRLYRGPFMEDLYMEWVDQRREVLRGRYLDALISLGEIEMRGKRFREARETYERIVASDPYRDEAHLALMKSMVASGATSTALAHYKDYKALLRHELNAEPIEALQEYYQQLIINV